LKTLLKLLFVAALLVGVVGWWEDWFKFSYRTGEDGHSRLTIDADNEKIRHDLDVVKAKSRDMLDRAGDQLKSLKEKASTSTGEQKTKIDRSIRDLEDKRDNLQDQLVRLSDQTGESAETARHTIERQIVELDAAIEKAKTSH